MIDNGVIKKFMKKMGMKIYAIPHVSSDAKDICIHLRVRQGETLQYYVEDCYEVRDNGKVRFIESEYNFGASDGVFAYLGDDTAVDNFFLDVTQAFAQKFIDEKIKPS